MRRWRAHTRELDRYRYLRSSGTDKEQLARAIAAEHGVREGLVCVLQCVEPCWTFDKVTNLDGLPMIRGEKGKCSNLYHYYLHPQFGWNVVGSRPGCRSRSRSASTAREWLARQMDREGLKYYP